MLDSDGSYGAEGGGGRIETHLEKSHKLLKSDKEVGTCTFVHLYI